MPRHRIQEGHVGQKEHFRIKVSQSANLQIDINISAIHDQFIHIHPDDVYE